MTKLYLKTGSNSVNEEGLLPGTIADIYKTTNKISAAAAAVLHPVDIAANNTIDTLSNPQNIFKGSTYKNALRFLPKAILHEIALVAKMPFATVDRAIEYFLLNNMERLHQTLKGTTYGALSLALQGTNPSKFRKYTIGAVGKGIEHLGDGIGSLIKSPFWLVHKPFEYINDKLKPLTEKTTEGLLQTKTYTTPYINPGLLKAANNTDYNPSKAINKIDNSKLTPANNTDYKPKEKAA